VKNEGGKEHVLKWRKANWIGHILCRHCLLKHVIEGELDVTRRCRRGRHNNLLDHPKEMRRYWDLKEEAPWSCPKTGYMMTTYIPYFAVGNRICIRVYYTL
jgi:hypothetical protein